MKKINYVSASCDNFEEGFDLAFDNGLVIASQCMGYKSHLGFVVKMRPIPRKEGIWLHPECFEETLGFHRFQLISPDGEIFKKDVIQNNDFTIGRGIWYSCSQEDFYFETPFGIICLKGEWKFVYQNSNLFYCFETSINNHTYESMIEYNWETKKYRLVNPIPKVDKRRD